MNESQTNQTKQRSRSVALAVCIRVVWFALLFFFIAGLALDAVGASFPIPGGSKPRTGTAAIHESIGVIIMQVIHGPFSWLYSFLEGKTAGLLVWLIWAAGLYFVSALVRRPRWVFTPRTHANEP